MSYNIILGVAETDNGVGYVILPWDNHNGFLIAGLPGAGKSHLLSHILTQYALKGVDIVIADYNASSGVSGQTLLERTEHISGALIREPATDGNEVIETIKWLKREVNDRQAKIKPLTPLVVVFDEFFQFAANVKAPDEKNVKVSGDKHSEEGQTTTATKLSTFWEEFLAVIVDCRKYNVRVIIASQEFSARASSTLVRAIRDKMTHKLLMTLDGTNAALLGMTDTASKRMLDHLPTGQVYYKNANVVTAIPYPINPKWIDAVISRRGVTPQLVTSAPVEEFPTVKLDGRWSHTRSLAALLGVDFSTLKEKDKYNVLTEYTPPVTPPTVEVEPTVQPISRKSMREMIDGIMKGAGLSRHSGKVRVSGKDYGY